MYFTKVELHNFGIYQGHHEMCLADRVGERNVTLIGGLNGRGKTTFLDAILLALYGKQALKYIQENGRSYEKLLLEHINKHATDDRTYVAVSLRLDDGTALRVCRMWRMKGKKADESICVEKNGVADKYLGESWSYYIEEILPFGIARFFFFDNEKITQLADDLSFEQIKSSIKSAIGVSAIERAIGHADEVIRRKERELKDFEESTVKLEYQEAEDQLRETGEKLAAARSQAAVLQEDCARVTEETEEREREFWASSGDLTLNQESIKGEVDRITAQVEELRNEILLLVSDPATPLFLCRQLLSQVYDAEIEGQRREAIRISDSVIGSLRGHILDRIGRSGLHESAVEKVKRIVDQEIEKLTASAEIKEHISLSPTTMLLFEKSLGTAFQDLDQRIDTLTGAMADHEHELESLDAHLRESDERGAAMQLYEILKESERKKTLAEDALQKQLLLIEGLERQQEQLHNKCLRLIKNIAEEVDANDDNARVIKYAVMSIQVLGEFKLRLQREKIKRLAETATECFQTLVEKDSLISQIQIDMDTLDVAILGSDGRELQKNQLSAGEQQMFAISIVWALARTSGYRAPVVIDTPMARLDSSHRANFVEKYLPAASSQVLVLSTDEEIYGRYLDMIRDHVAAYFTLQYQEAEQCTTIVNGYFGEA